MNKYDSTCGSIVEAFGKQDYPAAIRHANELLKLAPDHGLGWIYLAMALHGAGNDSAALIAMSRSYECKQKQFPPEIHQPDIFTLFHEGGADSNARLEEMMKPCPIFGRAGTSLSKQTENTIEHILDARLSSWASGDIPAPKMLPKAVVPPADDRPIKLLLIQTEFILNANYIRNDITEALLKSAQSLNWDVRRSLASEQLIYSARSNRQAGFDILQAEIQQMRPDIVLIDGNPTGAQGEYDFFADRAAQGYKLVVLIPDCYDVKPNNFDFWAGLADLVIYLNQRTTHRATSSHAEKGLYWPGLPFDPEMFSPQNKKTNGLCILGSLNRDRDIFAGMMKTLKVPGIYLVHDRSQANALSAADYRHNLSISKMTFNNGTLTPNLRIVTARVFEAIWSKSLLLEEAGADTNEILIPFIHYIPFANVAQLVSYAQFFEKHEDRRQRIVDAAYDWALQHFLPSQFWTTVRQRVGV